MPLSRHTAVLALGGNALAPAGEPPTIANQFRHTREALSPIVELALEGWNVCLVHGNGPQVGDEVARHELSRHETPPLPLGVLVAATAGWIGYMIQQSLDNALRCAGSDRRVATIITQVQVDPADPALNDPTKFIGQEVTAERAKEMEAEGHVVRPDGRGHLRRVVGSPSPLAIHEIGTIRRLVEDGTLVIAGGGGGAPIYFDNHTQGWEGIDAVVDKDYVAAVLARDIGAEILVVLTDVDAVYLDWGTPSPRALRTLTIAEAEMYDRAGAFGEGSMAPKVRAAIDFVRASGGRAIITALQHGMDAVRGMAGTTITS